MDVRGLYSGREKEITFCLDRHGKSGQDGILKPCRGARNLYSPNRMRFSIKSVGDLVLHHGSAPLVFVHQFRLSRVKDVVQAVRFHGFRQV
jgi:hypothetical protein